MKFLVVSLLAICAMALTAPNATCGTLCPFGNNDCASSLECSRCDGPGGFNGQCAKGFACGHTCGGSGDCDQTSDCNLCMNGMCMAGCQRNCTNSSQCAPPCGKCVTGACAIWTCGNKCVVSSDCAGPCAQCLNGKCTALCGGPCLLSTDCDQAGCPHCLGGKCVSGGKCKSRCETDSQCVSAGNCTQCVAGHCAAGCGQPCTDATFCGQPGCGRCVDNKCAPWTCGANCTATGFGCAGNCALCLTGKCFALCGNECFSSADCPQSVYPYNCSTCTGGKCH